jgi:hypothetical protein
MDEWKIVTTPDGNDSEGVPLGHVLCKNLAEGQDLIKRLNLTDATIEDYQDYMKKRVILHNNTHLNGQSQVTSAIIFFP